MIFCFQYIINQYICSNITKETIMERLLIEDLKRWKTAINRKPLILQGSRQVGKTWLLKEFGKRCFDDVCYINFEEATPLKETFDGSISSKRILEKLSAYHGKKIEPQHTLIIFDEVQEMPRAITSLKYFAEESPEYAICCAGSLLGIALHAGTSFPVGKVDFLTLRPLSFHEFLIANGKELIANMILDGSAELPEFREMLTDLLKNYFVVGGMPAVVEAWMNNHDYQEVERIQADIIRTYDNDFSKHAPKPMAAKIRYVWNSIPSQLAKENKKFVYGLVREGARAREYEDAIMWLSDAGMIHQTFRVKKPDIPIKAYTDLQSFKIFMLDVGLLRAASGVSPKTIIEGNRIFEEFKGAMTEQYVLQELMQIKGWNGEYYWASESKAEVDFLITDGYEVYPLEVKAEMNVKARSLMTYMDKYAPKKAFRTSMLPYSHNGSLTNLPLYMLFAFRQLGLEK